MRMVVLFALTALPFGLQAAPTWQLISAEPGKRIELDRISIKREDGGKVLATGRTVLEKGITDLTTGATFRIIEATISYECATRNAATVKRVYKKDESEVLREEEIKGRREPVRVGTLEDKVLREVCRPPAGSREELTEKANEAAGKVKAANDALLKKETARAYKVAAPAHAAPADHPAVPAAQKAKKGKVHHEHVHWSYAGEGAPENWHKLDAANRLCGVGQRQSPIDIRDGIKVDLESLRFDYRPSLFSIVDNGHTIQVSPGSGSLTVTGKTYDLVQFHFHRPSEEAVGGKRFDMVAHLVHKSRDGQLAVVAVLMEKGGENPLVQTLWNNLPLERNLTVSPPAASIDLNAFLPANRSYYTYMGSLTTPPCSEGVLWIVMKQPVPVSPDQLDIFARLYPNNARPLQPASNRLIKEGR